MPSKNGWTRGGVRVVGTLDGYIETYVRERVRRCEVQAITATNLRYHLTDFSRSFGSRPVTQLGLRSVERWVEQMETAGVARSTQANRLSSLRGFAAWMARRGTCANFTIDAPKIRRPRVRARDMSNEHVHLTLEHAHTERDRLTIWLMFGCGLRRIEAHRLNVEDWQDGTLFLTGKGLHERVVPTIRPVEDAIEAYLRVAGHQTGAMLRTYDGRHRLSCRMISQVVTRMVTDAGLKIGPWDGRSPHGFRAAGASDLADVAKDVREIQEFLGHADLSHIHRYLLRLKARKLREAQERRPDAA